MCQSDITGEYLVRLLRPWPTHNTLLLRGVTKRNIDSDHVANIHIRNFHSLCRTGYEVTVSSFSSAYSCSVRFRHNVGCQKEKSKSVPNFPAFFPILQMVNGMVNLVHSTLYVQMTLQFKLLWHIPLFF